MFITSQDATAQTPCPDCPSRSTLIYEITADGDRIYAAGAREENETDLTPKGLRQFYLRTLARGFAKTPKRVVALMAMLDGVGPSAAARKSGVSRQRCSQILRAFQTFVEREEKRMKERRRAAVKTEGEDLTQVQLLERMLELEI